MHGSKFRDYLLDNDDDDDNDVNNDDDDYSCNSVIFQVRTSRVCKEVHLDNM